MPKPAKKKAARKKEREPDRGLVIAVGWQNNGGVYMLELRCQRLIHERYPDALILPVVVLGYDKSEDYNRYHRPHWETLAQILTGLTPEQLADLGGVSIYDPDNEKVIWRWQPASLKAG